MQHSLITILYTLLRCAVRPVIKRFFIARVSGLENIPQRGPAILAMNHQSLFDFICLISVVNRNIHFLAAEKFFLNKFWKIIMFMTGQIKVDRNNPDKQETHGAVERHVEHGSLIGIFPEGTRSPFRDKMLKAFTGVARYSLKHRVPVIPIGITGTIDILPKHSTYPKILKSATINIGAPLVFGEHHHKHGEKEVCVYVTECVIRQIEKLSGKEYPHYESNFS